MNELIIYGSGKIAMSIYSFLKSEGLSNIVDYFCDESWTIRMIGDKMVAAYKGERSFQTFIIAYDGDERERVRKRLEEDKQKYIFFEDWIEQSYEEPQKKLIKYNRIKACMKDNMPSKMGEGVCPICKLETIFISFEPNLIRENYRCIGCGSSPRQRALYITLEEICPEWREMCIHESSPSGVLANLINEECERYSFSFYFEEIGLGDMLEKGGSNQNLERLTFEDESFDVFITQDVFEHVNEPIRAFNEIKRVLKIGGKHIFTVPVCPGNKTVQRVKVIDGKVVPILEEKWHGNPISDKGSLVTYDWCRDMAEVMREGVEGIDVEIYSFPRNRKDIDYGTNIPLINDVIIMTRVE